MKSCLQITDKEYTSALELSRIIEKSFEGAEVPEHLRIHALHAAMIKIGLKAGICEVCFTHLLIKSMEIYSEQWKFLNVSTEKVN